MTACTPENDPNNGNDNGSGTYNGHEYVDLGLPSGTLWATCNVGAEKPEDYGDYFAWGETSTKTSYDWSSYKYCNGENEYGDPKLTKYCHNANYGYDGFSDNLTVLQLDDDAATTRFGSGWCIPTTEQWQELIDNTTSTWVIQNSVNGRLFSGNNGNSIFLPAAGARRKEVLDGVNEKGYYWASVLCTDDDRPFYGGSLEFEGDNCRVTGYYRFRGQTVRAVRSAE